jgi:hypothetical protein
MDHLPVALLSKLRRGRCLSDVGREGCPTEPGNVFTEQHFFYKGVEDDRQCSACTCGAPTGSTCTAKISIYEDTTCSAVLNQDTISSVKSTCAALSRSLSP